MHKKEIISNINLINSELAMTTNNTAVSSRALGLEFLNDNNVGTGINEFNFSTGWISENLNIDEAYGGDDHWTTQVGSTVIINFISSKFYIVAIKDPYHGIMTISIDGSAEINIDLYASTRTFKQIVYESALLTNSLHKIVLRCSGRKNPNAKGIAAFIDGIFIQPSTVLTFINNSMFGTSDNEFNFSSGWTLERVSNDEAYGKDNHWTNKVGATVSITITTAKFYIVAIKNVNCGIMTISIDGGGESDIDLYASTKSVKQIVYESPLLANSKHKILLKCSGRKNTKANDTVIFIDGIFIQASNGLTLINDSIIGNSINVFSFSNGWIAETLNNNEAYGGDDHWTNEIGATAKLVFNGTKFYIIAVKDPRHGIMEIVIDNNAAIDVDLYNNTRIFKQIVFESGDLPNGSHTVTIKCSGRKNINATGIAAFIDGIFILNNSSIGLFDVEKTQYSFNENIRVATLKVVRKGGINGSVSVDYITSSNTALEGVNYQSWAGTLFFNNGEKEKLITIPIINTNKITNSKNFTLKLSNPLGGAVLGLITETTISLLPKLSTTPSGNISTPQTVTNLALNKKAVSSSNESNVLIANYACDGLTTRWASGSFVTGQQWIYVDLAQVTQFNIIKILWHLANAPIYRIEISNDANIWTSIYRTTAGVGKTETINLNNKEKARYVRIFCEKSNTTIPTNNVSIYDIEIYNL